MKEISQEIKHNEFVRILLKSIGDGVFVLDTKGTIIAWNPAMEKIAGYNAEEVAGKNCSILNFSKCFGKKCPDGFSDCDVIKHGSVEPAECLLRHKNGHAVSVTKNASVIRQEDGTVLGIVEADGGTIFLDEIGDVSPYIQIKLLRVLQQREVERVGESKKRKVDIRIITATNKDLGKLVQEGSFREDLYYRLKVFPIYLPPLRQRKEDIPLLANHFIKVQNRNTGKKIRRVSQPAMKAFFDYQWPGNVRELGNAIEHAFVICANEEIDVQDLPVEISQKGGHSVHYNPFGATENKLTAGKKLTREKLFDILNECEWNKAEVARRVGLSRASIWKYMKKWNMPFQKDQI